MLLMSLNAYLFVVHKINKTYLKQFSRLQDCFASHKYPEDFKKRLTKEKNITSEKTFYSLNRFHELNNMTEK